MAYSRYKNANGDKPKENQTSAKQKALDILLYRTRTKKELYDKLLEKGYSEEESLDALSYVESFGYVNDEEYAIRYVMSNGHTKGRSAIIRELKAKGVNDDYIENALYDLPDDYDVIRDLLIKKAGEPHELEEKEFRRLYGFFLRRGFNQGSIMRVLKEYSRNEDY